PMVSVLDELSVADLEHILMNTKNALVKQFSKLLRMEGVHLHYTRDAITAIAEQAKELKTGARALRSIMERLMLDVMYELPSSDDVEEVTINRSVVEGRAKPKIKRTGKKNAA
ncbi:MAG: ATP-dependent Clp protease ATP-binding subunit ClpX, partial [Verrucomicrobiota bacterium]